MNSGVAPLAGRTSSVSPPPGAGVRLGLRANLDQFCLLVAVNALVGGTLGQVGAQAQPHPAAPPGTG